MRCGLSPQWERFDVGGSTFDYCTDQVVCFVFLVEFRFSLSLSRLLKRTNTACMSKSTRHGVGLAETVPGHPGMHFGYYSSAAADY